ncbi:hypothetical protein I307_04215 [Cryptococcus deuterogattii 99/473]|uniref:Uncharacterized protein n=1 Tax=Cryptococcus deuterogattii Ram5 TaxID=1296110 RepID=A0A0D0V9J8_9TREE|nr:hypothetical protein I313_01288 [Cryptococcus deuterogattii Ram5]KIY56416.1 hypothetical protein I307_04215 [Cryptococcus deuterogattii 99/473]
MERAYCIINPNLKPIDAMLQGPVNDNQPFLFARVMRIFHIDIYKKRKAGLVTMNDVEKHSLPIIWIRWYETDGDWRNPLDAKHMYQLKSMEGPDAYGFIGPTFILQACHLIPCFKNDGRELHSDNRDGDLVAQANFQNSSTGKDDMINVNAGADHNESDYQSDEDDSEPMEEEDDSIERKMREPWLRMEEDW